MPFYQVISPTLKPYTLPTIDVTCTYRTSIYNDYLLDILDAFHTITSDNKNTNLCNSWGNQVNATVNVYSSAGVHNSSTYFPETSKKFMEKQLEHNNAKPHVTELKSLLNLESPSKLRIYLEKALKRN